MVGYFARLVVPEAWIGLLGLLPVAIGIKKLFELKSAESEEESKKPGASVLTIAAVTFANGGDNIGICTPLFAASDHKRLSIMLTVFFILVAVWCIIGCFLSKHPLIAKVLDRYGHLIVPFVLIGLGIYILIESGTLKLIGL
jgi:cadmium resistance protein CadD (predicted permease)